MKKLGYIDVATFVSRLFTAGNRRDGDSVLTRHGRSQCQSPAGFKPRFSAK